MSETAMAPSEAASTDYRTPEQVLEKKGRGVAPAHELPLAPPCGSHLLFDHLTTIVAVNIVRSKTRKFPAQTANSCDVCRNR